MSTIYTGSVSDMIERLRDLDEGCDMEAVMNMNFDDGSSGGGLGPGYTDPFGGGAQRGYENYTNNVYCYF